MDTKLRAIGIVRVSEVGGRNGDSFHSPGIQRERIEAACKHQGLRLIDTHEEMDVSAGKPLAGRPGLSSAVAAIEDGRADVVAAAYFDRLFRSLETQREVIDRVEAAGGQVIAIDTGRVSNGNSGQRLTGTMLGAVAEYHRMKTKEALAEVQVRCIARGVPPFPTPPGYRRAKGEPAEPDPATAPHVLRAFELRAENIKRPSEANSLPAVRRYLADHGIRMSLGGLVNLLANRFYLGELHYGDLEPNLKAHEPIVPAELFELVQKGKGTARGRIGKSDRLLARLGVLRCATDDGRMSVSSTTSRGHTQHFYRCTAPDCTKPMTIGATLVEREVIAWVKQHLAGLTGTASGASGAEHAREQLDAAQGALDAAMRSFADAGLGGEPVALETLDGLREARDLAKDQRDEAVTADESLTVAVTVGDWEKLNQDERRALIKATVARAVVHPGRGPERIEIVAR